MRNEKTINQLLQEIYDDCHQIENRTTEADYDTYPDLLDEISNIRNALDEYSSDDDVLIPLDFEEDEDK